MPIRQRDPPPGCPRCGAPAADGEWRNVCDGAGVAGPIAALRDLLAGFPVALLEREG